MTQYATQSNTIYIKHDHEHEFNYIFSINKVFGKNLFLINSNYTTKEEFFT